MTLPDDLKFLERFITPLQLEVSPASILRVCLWTIFFSLLAHLLAPKVKPQLPHNDILKTSSITPLASTPSDPRYTRLDLKKVPDNSIIWVGGSSLAIMEDNKENYTFLPSLIDTGLQQHLSIKMASRLLDTYTMTLDAIEREPDVLFVALNPFWILNDKSLFFKTNLMNRGTALWTNENDWPLMPLLSSPGNLLWNGLGRHHAVMANGYDYLKLAQPPKPKKVKRIEPKQKRKLTYNQPLLFWISQRYDTETDFSLFDTRQWQLKSMEQNNEEESQLAQQLLRNMFKRIKDSGIPTLIYLAPTDYSLTETNAIEGLRAVQRQINKIAYEYKSPNIRLVSVPFETYDTLTFKDYLHLSDAGTLPGVLSAQIESMRLQK
ncbi:MAG: hypothetical protein AAF988_05090 [Pseudomonadota bacterium]